jgi:CMP-N-acetylneuraminic acid synthetase
LARDDTPTEPVLQQVIKYLEEREDYRVKVVVLLQPTSPLRKGDDIDLAYQQFEKSGADSLLSVCERRHLYWREEKGVIKPYYRIEHRPRRQEMKPWLQENGAIYITRREILMEKGNRLGGKIAFYLMDEERSIEVDTEFDFWICEQILRR